MGQAITKLLFWALLAIANSAHAIPIFQERAQDTSLGRLWIGADDLSVATSALIQGNSALGEVVVIVYQGQSKVFRISDKPTEGALWFASQVWFRLSDLTSLGLRSEIIDGALRIGGKTLPIEFISNTPQVPNSVTQAQIQTAVASKNCGRLGLLEIAVPDSHKEIVARVPLAVLITDLQMAAECIGIGFRWDNRNLHLTLGNQNFTQSSNVFAPNPVIPFRDGQLIAFNFPGFAITSSSRIIYSANGVTVNFDLVQEKIVHPILMELEARAVKIADKASNTEWDGYPINYVCSTFQLACSIDGSTLKVNGQNAPPSQVGLRNGELYASDQFLGRFVSAIPQLSATPRQTISSLGNLQQMRSIYRNDLSRLSQIIVNNQTFISLSQILNADRGEQVSIGSTTVSFPKSAFGAGLSNIPLWAPKAEGELFALLLDPKYRTPASVPTALSSGSINLQVYVPVRQVSKIYSRISFDSATASIRVRFDELSDGIHTVPLGQINRVGSFSMQALRDTANNLNKAVERQIANNRAEAAARAEVRRKEIAKYQNLINFVLLSHGVSPDAFYQATPFEDIYVYSDARGVVLWGGSPFGVCRFTLKPPFILINAVPTLYFGEPVVVMVTNALNGIVSLRGAEGSMCGVWN